MKNGAFLHVLALCSGSLIGLFAFPGLKLDHQLLKPLSERTF